MNPVNLVNPVNPESQALQIWFELETTRSGSEATDAHLALRCPSRHLTTVHTSYVVLVDRSASMWWGESLPALGQALAAIGRRLPPHVTLTTVAFGECDVMLTNATPGGSPELEACASALLSVDVGSGTCLAPVLERVQSQRYGVADEILLISDGDPELPEECRNLAAHFRDSGARLHTLSIGTAEPSGFLADLARVSGGQSYRCTSPEDVEAQLERFFSEHPDNVQTATITLNLSLRNDLTLKTVRQIVPSFDTVECVEELPTTPTHRTWRANLRGSDLQPSFAVVTVGVPPLPPGDHGIVRVATNWTDGYCETREVRANPDHAVAQGALATLLRQTRADDPLLVARWTLAFEAVSEGPDAPGPSHANVSGSVASNAALTERTTTPAVTLLGGSTVARSFATSFLPTSTLLPSLIPTIAVEGAPHEPARVEIPVDRPVMRIGRCNLTDGRFPDVDLLPYDPGRTVSREHARLEYDGEHFFITDLGSTNGTFLSGSSQPLPPHTRYSLEPGQNFQVGSVSLHVQVPTREPLPQEKP